MKSRRSPANDVGGSPKAGRAAEEAGELSPLCPAGGGDAALQEGFCLNALRAQFGSRLLIMLFTTQHLMKGFATSLTGPSVSFIYKAYRVPGPQAQIFGGVTMLPWAMKPVIGLVSDAFPIFGYHKAPYMLLSTVAGIFACATVGVTPQDHLRIQCVVACLFMMQMQFSTCDLLAEAKYAEKMKSKPQYGPMLMTYVWFGLNAGGLAATALVGPMMAHFGIRSPFLAALIPMSLVIVPLLRNFMEETPRSPEQQAEFRAQLMEQKAACFLCLLMFASTIVLTVLGIVFDSAAINAVGAICVATVMLIAFSLVLKPIIAKVNAFFLVQTAASLSIGGGSFYFYTDSPEQYPEGPHFSQEFYTSVLGVISALCALAGVWTYQHYASDWTYRRLLLTTNVLASLFSLSDVILFTRLNVKWGLPDHGFVLGSSVLSSVIGQWMWMPGVVILSQLCPHGMEATMYALLAGCHNLGMAVSSNLGALMLEWLDCQPSGQPNETAQFKNLWMASLLSTLMPAVTLILLPWLIPDAKQTDRLLAEDDRDATEGSVLRQWLGR